MVEASQVRQTLNHRVGRVWRISHMAGAPRHTLKIMKSRPPYNIYIHSSSRRWSAESSVAHVPRLFARRKRRLLKSLGHMLVKNIFHALDTTYIHRTTTCSSTESSLPLARCLHLSSSPPVPLAVWLPLVSTRSVRIHHAKDKTDALVLERAFT